MDKKFAIFDMDGTLVDSMGYWQALAEEFLVSKGVTNFPNDLRERIKAMTMAESAALFVELFHLPCTPQAVCDEMNSMMEEHYRRDVPLKPGVREYLQQLREKGVRMCVASATVTHLVKACLMRLEVLDYFEFALSCEEVGAGKGSPVVYHTAAERMGAAPSETAVYEDAIFAAKTAKKAGYYVVGVYDDSAKAHWEELTQLADETIRSF